MKWFAGLSIFKKIISIFISTFVVLSLLISIYVWKSFDVALSQQFQKTGVEIATRLASLSSEHILFNDPFALSEVAEEIKKSSEEIRYILILDHKMRVLAHTFPDGIPKGLLAVNANMETGSYRIEQIDSDEGLMLDIMAPIEEGRVGFARVGISENNIRIFISENIREILLITLLVSLAATLFTARMMAYITRPIRDLAVAAGEVASGNIGSQVEVHSKDEIGQLASAFNHMTESLIVINRDREALLASLKEKERLRSILLSELITAQENERGRISRELHDETSQALTSLIVSTRLLADHTKDQGMQDVIKGIREVIARIMTGIRDLAVELRPPSLDDLGLSAAMEKYLLKYQDHFRIAVAFTSNLAADALDKQIALTLYRIMQESLTNVAKHAGASHVQVSLDHRERLIQLTISDDGKGISAETMKKAKDSNRIGLFGMKERAELCGGTFTMATDGSGTTITIRIPTGTDDEMRKDQQ